MNRMILIDMPMPEKCSDCIFCDDNCSCVASDYNGMGICVGCAYRTGRRDIRCPMKEHDAIVRCKDCKNIGYTNSHWFCRFLNRCVDEDWFCADGERRKKDDT